MNKTNHKIIVGISSCLLGNEVRYDGGHKSNAYIRKTLNDYFEFKPFCPELESGMTVPRPPIQLRYTDDGIKAVGVKDHNVDVTNQLQSCSSSQDQWLSVLSGYILKKDSPSCGMERVKVYRNEFPERNGTGIFAQYLKEHFPLLPLEEEGRLGDTKLREKFIQRVYVFYRWKQFSLEKITPNRLYSFHSQHKLIAMSHEQNLSRDLGRLVASSNKDNIEEIANKYIELLMRCLKITATRGNHVNTLQHIQGYLKKMLDFDDKAELIESIERYRLEQLPLIVPITLLRHHFRKQPNPFISQSYYMYPYPKELTLLNDI